MLLYYHSCMFYNHFISFFGSNLLTQCPVPVAVFCLFFTSQEINIKQSPNIVKLFGDFVEPEGTQWARAAPGGALRGHNPPGRTRPPWRAQMGCAHLGGLPYSFFAL